MKIWNKFKHLRTEIEISFLYLIFGGLWILFSDRILDALVSDPHTISQIQTYKGWGFVFVSALLIYYLVHLYLLRIQLSSQILKENEEKFRLIFSMSHDAILLTTTDGRVLAANPSACKMFGRSEEEIIQIGRDGLVDMHDPQVINALEQRKINGYFSGTFDFRRSDNTFFSCEVSSAIYCNTNGIEMTSMIIRDISERIKAEADLRESEEKFSIMFKKSVVAATLSDLTDGRMINVNEQFEKVFGYSEAEAVGKTSYELGINPSEEARAKILSELRKNHSIRMAEMVLHTRSGEPRLMSVSLNIINMLDKQYILNLTEDITEKRQAEIALRQSEENLRKAQGYANLGNWIWHTATGKLDVSDQLLSIYGIARSDFDGSLEKLLAYIKPEDKENVSNNIRSTIDGKEPGSITYQIIRDDGEVRTVWAVAAEYTLDPDGINHTISGVIQDITNRVETEEKIELQSKALESAANAIMITNSFGKIEWVNPAFTKLTGYKSKDVLGKSPNILRSGLQDQDYYRRMWETIKAGKIWNSEIVNKHHDGHLYIEYETITPLLDNNGKVSHFISIKQDITERKKSEQKLRESEERLRLTLKAAKQGIFDQNLVSGATIVNDTYAEMLGYDPFNFEESQQKWFERIHPDDRASANVLLNEYIHGHIPEYRIEIRQKTQSGQWKWLLVLGSVVEWDRFGQPVRMLGTQTDITEIKESSLRIVQLLEESDRRLKRIESLHAIDNAISSDIHSSNTLKVIIDHIKNQLGVDAAMILLYDREGEFFYRGATYGVSSVKNYNSKVNLNSSMAGRAASERRIIQFQFMQKDVDAKLLRFMKEEGFEDYYAISLSAKGRLIGVLELFNRTQLNPDQEWLQYYETLAGQAAIAIENAQLIEGLQQAAFDVVTAYDATIEGWSHALDLRDKETEGHTQRVTRMTVDLAKALNFSEREIVDIRRGSLLHDIGKMGIPDSILYKPGLLTAEERKIMQHHPIYAYEMLSSIEYLKPALEIPHLHHEKWDGSGYPHGLAGEDIPLSARMFAIVDVYDALTSDRPYREAWSKEKTLDYILSESGKHFDPKIVEIFLKYIEK